MKKIIIAEDVPCVLEINLGYLSDACNKHRIKVKIDVAYNGKDLLAKVLKKDYDLILTDNKMMGHDGLEAIKNIRLLEKEMHRNKTPIYMIASSSSLEEALKAGATGYVYKGDHQEFQERIKEIILKHLK